LGDTLCIKKYYFSKSTLCCQKFWDVLPLHAHEL